jgi:hypothetical protein
MPRSDDQYDLVHTYSQAKAGKSKTTAPAVKELGRDNAAVQLYVGKEIAPAALRTPPSGVHFLFFDQSGSLRAKDSTGSVTTFTGGAPTDASYVTINSDSDLSAERTLNATGNLTQTDNGANSAVDLDTVNSPTFTAVTTDSASVTNQVDAGSALLKDAAANPGTNGVIQRNGADVKVYSGGSTRNLSDISSSGLSAKQVSTNTTTSGSGIYLVDTSSSAITLTLSTSDATGEASIGVLNISGSNGVTVNTQGGETIDPGGASSKTLTTEGYVVWFHGDGTNWDSSLDIDAESVTVDTVDTDTIENDDYHEGVTTQSGSTGDLDLSASNLIKQTVTGNITFSFNNASSSPAGNSFLLIVEQDATGGHTLSWPSAVEWAGGSAPGVSTNANDTHVFSFVSPDGGSTWYGFLSGEGMA